MLHEFLTDNRDELIERCRLKVAMRRAPRATPKELSHGVPLFLDQLTEVFEHGPARPGGGDLDIAPPASPGGGDLDIARTAASHGRELLMHDFTIEQVVHDYGDLCQSITELAVARAEPIPVQEFGSLNITLDNAIASAVASFSLQNQKTLAGEAKLAATERLGFLANEMRNLLNTAILATSAIKRGSVGFGGATAAALDRSLIGMRGLIDRTLAEVRLETSPAPMAEVIEIGPFIAAVQLAAVLEAAGVGCDLTFVVEPDMLVKGDRHLLASAVANLLHGAVVGARDGQVFLTAYSRGGRVIIDIEAGCDIARDAALESTRKAVEANGGTLTQRANPDKGCLYTIDLPEIG